MQKNSSAFPVDRVTDIFGADETLAGLLKDRRILLIADANVVHRTEGLGARIGRYLREHGLALACPPLVLSGGEKLKVAGAENAHGILTSLFENHLGPDDAVLALGGGSVLDVTGYAVGQLRSTIPLFRLPTTPSALLGAAFAETAQVYFKNDKDALAVPSLPTAVLLDTAFATTVLDGVWRGGIGEAVRQGFLTRDMALLKTISAEAEGYRNRQISALDNILAATVASRARKGSPRRLDDLVRTLERNSDYKLPYGYGVSLATCLASEYARLRGDLREKDAELVASALKKTGGLDALCHSRHLLEHPETLAGAFGNADGSPVEETLFAEACGRVRAFPA